MFLVVFILFYFIFRLRTALVANILRLYLDVPEPPGDDTAVTSPPGGSPPKVTTPEPPSQEQERDRRKPEILDEDLNDDDVSVDDRLDVASLGDGSDDEILKAADCAESPFFGDATVAPGNFLDDAEHERRSAAVDDQVGSVIFTNQVRLRFVTERDNIIITGAILAGVLFTSFSVSRITQKRYERIFTTFRK